MLPPLLGPAGAPTSEGWAVAPVLGCPEQCRLVPRLPLAPPSAAEQPLGHLPVGGMYVCVSVCGYGGGVLGCMCVGVCVCVCVLYVCCMC